MAALPPTAIIGIVGAGAMGAGIAQVAAQSGHEVLLYDAFDGAAAKGKAGIVAALGKLTAKSKLTPEDATAISDRITICTELTQLAPAALIIEAIVEKLEIKHDLFRRLEDIVGPECILSSNTSSLSLTALASVLKNPARMVGMHFFNPAPIMALVEVVKGLATAEAVAQTITDTAAAWGKSPVLCKSTPGFIVNRVARPFYAEGMRLAQEGAATIATIDAVLREAGQFRMGPFELTDMIGHDVNFAVTRSVHAAYFNDPRFLPSLLQQDLVDAGWLGRKSGRGFYDYGADAVKPEAQTAAPCPAPTALDVLGDLGPASALADLAAKAGMTLARMGGAGMIDLHGVTIALTDGRSASERAAQLGINDLVVFDLALDWCTAKRIAIAAAGQCSAMGLDRAIGFFQALGLSVSVFADVPGLAVMRTIAMLANEAADTVYQGVASAADIDIAMTKGVNYPLGPLAWAERIGLDRVLTVLDNLARTYGEDRYRASAHLRRLVFAKGRFHD
ncbi:putative 3-hydroxybutyryl-CoA dehydrogenase [Magnetospirillum gryphiswaldense MSR-1 v2]|uniref:3-hydroxybutyryl-CoA dehydrogenase n=1 Tax=Magnetospirillum gryphiswaldense (strain DSM 6361 / JCM 21280 / NBRC 15271 / MSR-1) TaxID=431944 RepID=V6F4E4_MAGGM|nr:3-hydroxyacyl-CoA dehydrogenase PaaH [Magnetospirillum gryphiswaldense]CDL00390.1 putative 3-hydroxybutyryl-CoA dehydrogenase [Magnetospirillum gryphiswaldense MSR-1 v2]